MDSGVNVSFRIWLFCKLSVLVTRLKYLKKHQIVSIHTANQYYCIMYVSVLGVATHSTPGSYSVSHDAMMRLAVLFKEVHYKMMERTQAINKLEIRLLMVGTSTAAHGLGN